MCLVAFQKIFRKIFSGVWKRRRKTQIQNNTSHNPEKNHQRSRSKIDCASAISPYCDPRSRSRRRDLAINGDRAISRSTLREIAPSIAINGAGKIAIDASRDRDRRFARSHRRSRSRSKARSRSTARSRDGAIFAALWV